LKSQRIIHCDLKPENILLRQANKAGLKVIDLGSACFESERIYTYIQSRFYRSPEVMLGLPYTVAIDMWSFGCILAELFTGTPLFPGEDETDQMSCVLEVLGLPPRDLLVKGTRTSMFFNPDLTPIPVTSSRGRVRVQGSKPLSAKLACTDVNFIGFLESDFYAGCLTWAPDARCSPEEALLLPWISERIRSSRQD
jgi:dual specificity tyrosine-phosphorylation-regulated kinase 2/3/4